MVFQNNILSGVGGQGGDAAYTIDYSCRFNSADSAYMQRTFGAGNDEKFTVSFWYKKGIIDHDCTFLNAENSGSDRWRFDTATEQLQIYAPVSGNTTSLMTIPVYRDPSAWYHVVLVWDLGLLEGSRVQIYVNGVSEDLDVTTAPVSTSTYPINTAIAHEIGAREGTSIFFDGYLSQYCFIDNAALPPTSFGEFNNNVWRPIDITGLDYTGTNSFLLDFADSSDLGNDISGNNNDWTVSGIVAGDQVTDTPTNNFPTLTNGFGFNYTEGRLQVQTTDTTGWRTILATIRLPSTGKWCWQWTASTNGVIQFGAIGETNPLTKTWGIGTFANISDNYVDYYVGYGESQKKVDGTATSSSGLDSLSSGDTLQLLLDQDANTAKYYSNGVLQVTHTGLNILAYPAIMAYADSYGTPHGRVDYGQDGFTKIDSSYAYLNTANMPEPTIQNSKKYYDTILYEGNGLSQKVGQFQPITETYSVGNSALVVKGDSTELRKTWSTTASSTKDGTFSCWFKVGVITGSAGGYIITCGGGAKDFIKINTSDQIHIQLNNESNGLWTSGQQMEDSTQWTHLVVAYDLDNSGGDADRLRTYVNGVEITADGTFGSTIDDLAFSMNQDTVACAIGGVGTASADYMYDGYLAEVVWCDGQVLTPSSFGEVDSTTNRWIPKDVSGLTFGNNGFYLNMADKNDLGDDESGNTNDWTESGFDTTNGSNQYYDTPTRNFAIMDPGRSINETMTKGNLLGTSGGATGQVRTPNAFGLTSGKWYFEYLMTNGTTNERTMYITQDDVAISATQIRSLTGHYSGYYSYDGDARTPGDVTSTTGIGSDYGDTYTSGDVISVALDLDIGAIWWGKNGTWQNSATELEIEGGNASNAAEVGLAKGPWYPTMQNNTTQASQMNFGQHIYFDGTTLSKDTTADGYFRHAVPDGFKAIHVDHLTESDSFQSALCWIKNRDAADNHMLFDRPRGIYKDLAPNAVDVETTDVDTLTRFLKQGVTIGDDVQVNTASESYVLWDWFIETTGSGTANVEGATNTTATLVDTNSGVSISTYTGTGGATTLGHGLGVAPEFVIQKKRTNDIASWHVYHKNLTSSSPEDYYITLDASSIAYDEAGVWNDTAPTSTLISLGSGVDMNDTGDTFVIYAFAGIEGFSKFDSYIGNGLDDGPVNVIGFKPAWIMIKRTTTTNGDWLIYDNSRSPINVVEDQLVANDADAETTGSEELDFFANGFKIKTNDAEINTSGANYIYAAFAQNPFGGESTTPSTAR